MAAPWVGRAATLASVACLLLVAYALVAGRIAVVRVGGGSMSPALWPGDVCLVTDVGQPSTSDIVLLAELGHTGHVLHRVRAIQGTDLITQGDANPTPDRVPVARNAVLGRVSAVLPVGRLLRRWQGAFGK